MCPLSHFLEVEVTALLSLVQIERRIRPLVEAEGVEWVGLKLDRGSDTRLCLFVDTENGITLDQCEKISRLIEPCLDEMYPDDQERYYFEVSSPGLERPLFERSHFEKFVGRIASVRFVEPVAGYRKFEGVIVAIDQDLIRLEHQSESDITCEFSFDQVKEAHLVYLQQKGQKKTFKKGGGR